MLPLLFAGMLPQLSTYLNNAIVNDDVGPQYPVSV